MLFASSLAGNRPISTSIAPLTLLSAPFPLCLPLKQTSNPSSLRSGHLFSEQLASHSESSVLTTAHQTKRLTLFTQSVETNTPTESWPQLFLHLAVTLGCCFLLVLLLLLFHLISGRPTVRPLNRNQPVLIICVVGATGSCCGLIFSVANHSRAPVVPPSTPPLIFHVIVSLRALTAGSLTPYFLLHGTSSADAAEVFFSLLNTLLSLLIQLQTAQPDYFLAYYNS